jgi:BON domain
VTDLHHGSGSPGDGFSDFDLERLARVLIDRSIDKRRDHVELAVEDGWVTVTGEVCSARRKADVERHVRSLAGVKGITSKIRNTGAGPIAELGWPLSGE